MSKIMTPHGNYFDALIAELTAAMWDTMGKVTSDLCFGCKHDSPGQRDHDVCLMMSESERLDHCFDTCWTRQDTKPLITFIKGLIETNMTLDLEIRQLKESTGES